MLARFQRYCLPDERAPSGFSALFATLRMSTFGQTLRNLLYMYKVQTTKWTLEIGDIGLPTFGTRRSGYIAEKVSTSTSTRTSTLPVRNTTSKLEPGNNNRSADSGIVYRLDYTLLSRRTGYREHINEILAGSSSHWDVLSLHLTLVLTSRIAPALKRYSRLRSTARGAPQGHSSATGSLVFGLSVDRAHLSRTSHTTHRGRSLRANTQKKLPTLEGCANGFCASGFTLMWLSVFDGVSAKGFGASPLPPKLARGD